MERVSGLSSTLLFPWADHALRYVCVCLHSYIYIHISYEFSGWQHSLQELNPGADTKPSGVSRKTLLRVKTRIHITDIKIPVVNTRIQV